MENTYESISLVITNVISQGHLEVDVIVELVSKEVDDPGYLKRLVEIAVENQKKVNALFNEYESSNTYIG